MPAPTATRHQLQTKGQLQGLPIAWAQALAASSDSLRNMGLGGNLVFGGNWDIDCSDTLRAHAQLNRTSGDIQVQTGDIPNPTVVTSSGASMGPASTNASGRLWWWCRPALPPAALVCARRKSPST